MARTRKNAGVIGKRVDPKTFSKSGMWTIEDVVNNKLLAVTPQSDTMALNPSWRQDGNSDPYYNQVLATMDTDYPVNICSDLSPNAWGENIGFTNFNYYQLPILQGPRYQDWSTYFNEGGYYSVADRSDLRLGTSNFTIEFWYKQARQDATEYYLMGKGGNAGRTAGTGWVIYVTSAYQVGFYDAVNNTSITSSLTLTSDTWYHIAVVRSSVAASGLTIYVNGAQWAQGNSSGNFTDTNPMYIGRDRVATGTTWSAGWFTDIRISNLARYGSPFTRPSAALSMTDVNVIFSMPMTDPSHDNIAGAHQQGHVLTMPGTTAQRMIDSPFLDINNNTKLTGAGSHAAHFWDGSKSFRIYDNRTYTVTATTAGVLTCNSTAYMQVGQPLAFTGTPFASLTAITYYVQSIVSITQFTVSTTYGGAQFAAGTGTGSMTATNNSLRFGTGAFTVEGWVYLTNSDLSGGIIGKGTGNYGGGTGWSLIMLSGAISWADVSTTLTGAIPGTIAQWTGWYHFAAVRETTATNKFKMYINGALHFVGTVATDYSGTDTMFVAGSRNDQYMIRGSLSNLRLSKTNRYSSNFTVPTTPLASTGSATANGSVLPLLAGSGFCTLLLLATNAGAYITDSSPTPYTVSTVNTMSFSTDSPFASGGGSMAFNGTGYLTLPFNINHNLTDSNFTVEFWVKRNAVGVEHSIVGNRHSSTVNGWACRINSSNFAEFYYTGGTTATGTIPLSATGVWYHVAFTRINTSVRIFINGVLDTVTTVANGTLGTDILRIGVANSSNLQLNGFLTNLRILKGTALYTAGFNVDGTAFLDNAVAIDGNTSMTMFNVGTGKPVAPNMQFVDYGRTALPISRTSNEVRYGKHSANRHGFSFYHQQSQAKLFASTTQGDFDFGTSTAANTGDFSIEFWTMQKYGYDTFNTIRWLWDSRVFFNDSGIGIRISPYQKIDVVTGNTVVLCDDNVYIGNAKWTHIVVQRVNSRLALYVDGRKRSERMWTAQINAPGNKFVMGNGSYPSIQYTSGMYGYMCDVRMLKGTGAYGVGQIFATATGVAANIITVDSTSKMSVGQPIVFRGTAFSGASIVAGTTYYILTITSNTTLTISATAGGAVFAAGTGTGSMTVKVGVAANPETIEVPKAPLAAVPDTVLLISAAGNTHRDYSGRNNLVQAGGRAEANHTSAWDIYRTQRSPYSGIEWDYEKYMYGTGQDGTDGWYSRSQGLQGDNTHMEFGWITRMTRAWTIEIYGFGYEVNPAAPSSQRWYYTANTAGHEGFDWLMHYNGSASSWGDVTFRMCRSANSAIESISTSGATGPFRPHGWNHVAVVYNPLATNKVALFVNGNRVATRAAFTPCTKSWNTYGLRWDGAQGNGPIRISTVARYNNDATTYTQPEYFENDVNTYFYSRAEGPFIPKTLESTVLQYGGASSSLIKKFGNGSIYFPNRESTLADRFYFNNAGWATGAMSFRRGDFTIEMWATYRDATVGGRAIEATYGNTLWHFTNHIRVDIAPTGYWRFAQVSGGGSTPSYSTGQTFTDVAPSAKAATVAAGTWDHVVVLRRLGNYYLYINGVEKYVMYQSNYGSYTAGQGPTSDWYNDMSDGQYLILGTDQPNNNSTSWNGYIADFRVTQFARYESRVVNGVTTMCHHQTDVPALPTAKFPTK